MHELEVIDLKKDFHSTFLLKKFPVLKGINLKVEKGIIYGFLGPNGAGKTTTIKCILRLLRHDSGRILIEGKDIDEYKYRDKIGFLPEHPYFYDYLTARELLEFTALLFSMKRSEYEERINHLIELVGLKGKENIKLRKFSKGMIQRIGLAQSLMNNPQFIILDEPFSGLDPIGRKELRDIILGLKEEGKTIFFSSHILQDMELIVDKVSIILNGETKKEGKLSELITKSVEYYEIVFRTEEKAWLNENKLNYEIRDKDFIIKSFNEKEMNSVIEIIVKNRARIKAINPIRKTLEDIFLSEIKNES